MKRALVAVLIGSLSLPAFAGREIYTCEISDRYAVTPAGRLREATRGALGGTSRGMKFVIVRETGRVQGDAPFGLGPEAAPRVLQRGSEETYFIATYTGRKNNYASHEAIWVEEFATTRRKPFMAVEAGFVYTGTCE